MSMSCLLSDRSFTGQSPGALSSLNVDGFLYVGGVDDTVEAVRRTSVDTGFTGCVLLLDIQGSAIRLVLNCLFLCNITLFHYLQASSCVHFPGISEKSERTFT